MVKEDGGVGEDHREDEESDAEGEFIGWPVSHSPPQV